MRILFLRIWVNSFSFSTEFRCFRQRRRFVLFYFSASSLSIFFSSDQSKKSPTKKSKRSSSSNTSHRKSVAKDDENVSNGDPNDPRSISMFSSAKFRYFDEADIEEENENLDELGLQMHGSTNQLKYKYLGEFVILLRLF